MWIHSLQLIVVLSCLGWCRGLEKDIEVTCLDATAQTITEGGVIANCASWGLTRTRTMANWLFQLANILQGVNASYNHITQVSVFPVLPRVLSLNLQHNSIKDIEPLAFTGLENLQNLDLSYNRITGNTLKGVLVGKKAPERYEPLPIRMLFLSHNDISTIEPTVFEHLLYLRDLHLDYNPLVVDDTFTAALKHLPELKLLNMAGAGLSQLPKNAFQGLTITSLLLNGNQFTTVPDLTSIAVSLRLLNINQNPIEELDETSFAGLHSLSEIVVSGMPTLRHVHEGTFSGLENLRTVSCSYNPQLIDVDEKAFWNHDLTKRFPIKEVYLNNNGLPVIKKKLLPWLKVQRVTLDGNKWVCDCRLHWLATFLRNRNTTIDRLTELKCWEPIWLNGTQMVFWKIDLLNRNENFNCLAEREQERLDRERERMEMERRLEMERLEHERKLKNEAAETVENEDGAKLSYLIVIAGLLIVVVIIGSIIACNKYRSYRPIYNVEKVSSMQNEMRPLNGTIAEKTHLVP